MSTNVTYIPNMMRAMQDINSGAKKVGDFDWKQELENMIQFWILIPHKVPVILWLWGLISIIDRPEIRLDILKCLMHKYYLCANLVDERNEFFEAIRCMQEINERLCKFVKDRPYLPKYFDTDKSRLKELAYLLANDQLQGKDLAAIASELKFADYRHDDHSILTIVLKSYGYNQVLAIHNIIQFVQYLYKAEQYRQVVLSEKMDFEKLPVISSFPRKIKKASIDEYIDRRIEDIRRMFDYEKGRIADPTDLECYQKLLKEDKREIYIAQHSDQELYPDKKIVIELAEQYIQYLQKIIDELEKKSNIEDLMGAKTVNLAMGDIVNTKIVQK